MNDPAPPGARPAPSATCPEEPPVTVRRAVPADAAADVDAYVAAHFGTSWQQNELTSPAMCTLLAVDADGALVGYAQLRLAPTDDAPTPDCVRGDAPVELARFYVERGWHGRGVAGRLMAAVNAELAARPAGAAPLWLNVYQENARAVAFYRRWRFDVVGAALFWLGAELQRDWILARNIPSAPDG